MKNRKRKAKDRPKHTITVCDVQAGARRARHRSRLLVEVWRVLAEYVSDDGKPPKRRLTIDGDELVAERVVVQDLQGEILVAATMSNRRRRELLQQQVSTCLAGIAEPIFDNTHSS